MKLQHDWQNALWKILTNPATEVVAAIVVVLLAAWFVIGTEAFQNPGPQLLDPFGRK